MHFWQLNGSKSMLSPSRKRKITTSCEWYVCVCVRAHWTNIWKTNRHRCIVDASTMSIQWHKNVNISVATALNHGTSHSSLLQSWQTFSSLQWLFLISPQSPHNSTVCLPNDGENALHYSVKGMSVSLRKKIEERKIMIAKFVSNLSERIIARKF